MIKGELCLNHFLFSLITDISTSLRHFISSFEILVNTTDCKTKTVDKDAEDNK